MSKQTAQKAIDFLINVSGKRKNIDILFFGGEPLLNKTGFRFALEYASSAAKKANKKVNFRITTNGTLIDDDIATLIYKFKVKTMVSLDGPPQVHNSQCPMADGSNSYNKILNGLSVLQRHDNPYVIRCTMTHHPPPLLTLLNSLDKLAPKEIIVEPVLSPNYRYYNLTFDQDDYQKLIKQNETLLSKLIQDFKNGKCVYNPYRRFLQAINTFKHNDASIFHCGACRYSLNVGADGSLYPCCRFSGMPGWKIGNIYDKLDIEKSKRFWQFYEDVRNSRCSSCWAESICGGQCPWEWADKNGTFGSNDNHCFRRKAYIEQAAYFYWQIKDNKYEKTQKNKE